MSEIEKNITRINNKLQNLLKDYRHVQKDNKRQIEQIRELKEKNEKDKNKIHTMQEQINILKASTGHMNEKDKKAFEKIINQYLKEIDKCIGLLSE